MRYGRGRFHPAPWNGAGLPAPVVNLTFLAHSCDHYEAGVTLSIAALTNNVQNARYVSDIFAKEEKIVDE